MMPATVSLSNTFVFMPAVKPFIINNRIITDFFLICLDFGI